MREYKLIIYPTFCIPFYTTSTVTCHVSVFIYFFPLCESSKWDDVAKSSPPSSSLTPAVCSGFQTQLWHLNKRDGALTEAKSREKLWALVIGMKFGMDD